MSAPFRLYRLVHLSINPLGSRPDIVFRTPDVIQGFLTSQSIDWYRFASQNYVVWTNWDLATLTKSIAEIPEIKGIYVFASEFSIGQYDGMAPAAFWDWLASRRNMYGLPLVPTR